MSETMDLRDALAFYANPDNYAFNTEGPLGPNVILDGGSKARMILDDADEVGSTPLQAAALAALVAWRKAGKEYRLARGPVGPQHLRYVLLPAERELEAAADALIAAEGGTG